MIMDTKQTKHSTKSDSQANGAKYFTPDKKEMNATAAATDIATVT
jgi:hypothetical protein